MKNIFIISSFCFLCQTVFAQTVSLLTNGTKTSLRGMSVVDDNTIWVSGSGGTVGRSLDAGKTWKWMVVKGFEKNDFRDIEAFDKTTAVIMGIADPAYILRTVDGGENWKVVYENKTKGMFLDAMEFWNDQSGIVVGDPIDGKFFIARSFDGGNSWMDIPKENYPRADSGEACFASSGTNVRKLTKQEVVIITGGFTSHLIRRDHKILLPIVQGKESTGANSIAVKNFKTMMVVGGDFNARDTIYKNCIITSNAGKTWKFPQVPPHGYRSCVEYISKRKWVTCGLNGVDFTTNDGNTFSWISKDSYHVVRKAKNGKAVYLAGGGGRIGKLDY
ncbi:MAG: oxidoreductase [Ferruginibacter sp.]